MQELTSLAHALQQDNFPVSERLQRLVVGEGHLLQWLILEQPVLNRC